MKAQSLERYELFPAHAGVILLIDEAAEMGPPVPRTRGGDPIPLRAVMNQSFCSPHTRG